MAETSLLCSSLGFPPSATTFLFAGWLQESQTAQVPAFTLMADLAASSGVQLSVVYSNTQGYQAVVNAWDQNGGHAVSATINTNTDLTAWNIIALSCDTVTSTLQLLVNSLGTKTGGTFSGLPIITGAADTWQIGGNQAATCNLSQWWFAIGQPFFDLTNTANIALLRGSGLQCQVNWGMRGELLTGFSPQVFLFGDSAHYPHNYGTGAPFTVSGADFGNSVSTPSVCA